MKLDGLILAGGSSRRMGRDKGRLYYRGKTFVEILRDTFWQEAVNIWLSYGTEVGEEYVGCRTVTDRYPGCGPIGGIHTGLVCAKEEEADGVMVAACDMPLLRPEFYRYLDGRLREYAKGNGQLPRGVVPVANGRVHPLAAIYRTCMADILEEQIRRGNYRMMDALARTEILYVDVTKQPQLVKMLCNVNTPEDYEGLSL